MILESFSQEETEKIGFDVAKKFYENYKVFALYGGLGAGKTTFVRGFAEGLGINSCEVTSPTFSIMNEYEGKINLYHFDMYRITGYDDLVSTGFFDIISENEGVVLVEWSENIKEFLPKNVVNIIVTTKKHDKRSIAIGGNF